MSVINAGAGGRPLPVLTNPGGAGDLLAGKQLIDQYGNPITGLIPTKGAGDLTVSGAGIIVPAGYYAEQVSKEVPAATQAVPKISVSSAGLITASAAQEAGYVAAGSKSATQQLTTQAGKTVTPGTTQQTAVASGRYTTGAVYVAGDADLVAANIKSGVNIFGVTGTCGKPNTMFLSQGSKTVDSITFTASSTGVTVPEKARIASLFIYANTSEIWIANMGPNYQAIISILSIRSDPSSDSAWYGRAQTIINDGTYSFHEYELIAATNFRFSVTSTSITVNIDRPDVTGIYYGFDLRSYRMCVSYVE